MRKGACQDDRAKEKGNRRREEKRENGITHRGLTKTVSPQNSHRSRQRKRALRLLSKPQSVEKPSRLSLGAFFRRCAIIFSQKIFSGNNFYLRKGMCGNNNGIPFIDNLLLLLNICLCWHLFHQNFNHIYLLNSCGTAS